MAFGWRGRFIAAAAYRNIEMLGGNPSYSMRSYGASPSSEPNLMPISDKKIKNLEQIAQKPKFLKISTTKDAKTITQQVERGIKKFAVGDGIAFKAAQAKLSANMDHVPTDRTILLNAERVLERIKQLEYGKVLENNFPTAVKLYRFFAVGVKSFCSDVERYLKITRRLDNDIDTNVNVKTLKRNELELYAQLPRDFLKLIPVLTFFTLPVVGYSILPLLWLYPHKLLTTHFWTREQNQQFQLKELFERRKHATAVLKLLQEQAPAMYFKAEYPKIKALLDELNAQCEPSMDALEDAKPLFADYPLSLHTLSSQHVSHLCQLFGLHSWNRRETLCQHAKLLQLMDIAIMREGGLQHLTNNELYQCCYLRGLNSSFLTRKQMINWLSKWIEISVTLKKDQITFLLHMPLLLGYNHSNNRLLNNVSL